ncbi:uncharacterized protein ZBAI_02344 [Zygosaccharomyces bailii ISA1307]|nr:uncharacterized protein ZBAI_02344 [Zygosaccharomyces bailii ISA1307]
MPLLTSDYVDQQEVSTTALQGPQTPETSFHRHHNISNLEDYSIRDDDDEQTSSDDENKNSEDHENSSLKSWFFKPKNRSNSISPAKEATKNLSRLSSDSVIAEGTPCNSKTGSPFRKSLRSFFRREGSKELNANELKTSTSSGEAESQQQLDVPNHRFWKPWKGHRRHEDENIDSSRDKIKTLNVAQVDDISLLTHEQKRERNMEKLTQQLMDFPSSDEEERVVTGVQGCKLHETQDPRLSKAVLHEDDGSIYASSDSSTSSSIERAKEVKERVGSVFSPSAEDNSPKQNDVSPLTPVDDVMDNPYKYVFEPAEAHASAPVAYDCSWIDKNSVAFDNFDRALKMLSRSCDCVSSLDGSLFTVSELSNEILRLVHSTLDNSEKQYQAKKAVENTLTTIQDSYTRIEKEVESKNQEKVHLQKELEALKNKHSHLRSEFESLSEEAEILTDEIAQSKKNIFAAKDHERASIERAQSEAATLQQELQEVKISLDQALADKKLLSANYHTRIAEQDATRMQCKSLTEQKDMLQRKIESLGKEIGTMRTKQTCLQEEYESSKETNRSLQLTQDTLQAKYATMQAEYEELRSKNDVMQAKFDSMQNDYKTVVFDNEILQEKNNILTTRLSDLVGSMSKGENGEREMRNDLQVSGNKLRRFENIIELLKIGNLKIQDNFRAERNKVLDLRRENKILRKQLRLTECYRSQSLQFMSHLMLYYRGIVTEETLATFNFHLKAITEFPFVTDTIHDNLEVESKMKECETAVITFYSKVAKESFLDQIITKHVSYMRSNNFLSSQLSGLRKQISDYEDYVSRLLQEIETCKKAQEKNQRKISHLKAQNMEVKCDTLE